MILPAQREWPDLRKPGSVLAGALEAIAEARAGSHDAFTRSIGSNAWIPGVRSDMTVKRQSDDLGQTFQPAGRRGTTPGRRQR